MMPPSRTGAVALHFPALSLAILGLGLRFLHVATGVPPTAGDVTSSINEDVVTSIALAGSGSGTLVYTVTSGPLHGTAEVVRSRVTYTPTPDYNGTDSLQYRVQDTTGAWSTTATVSITIAPVNDAPVAVAQSVTASSGDATVYTLTGTDVDGDALTCALEAAATNGRARLSGCSVTYTSDASYVGPDSFTFSVYDGHLASAAATISVDVTPPNQPPVVAAQSVRGTEDTPLDVTLAATDPEGDTFTFAVTTAPSHGSTSLVGDHVTYTPDPDWDGTDTFKYKATDNHGATSNGATVSISLTSVNDPPVATPLTATADEDTQVSIHLVATDVESHSGFTYAIAAPPAHGTLTISNATVKYTGDADYFGPDVFTYVVNDGQADSVPAPVDILVNAAPDAPVAAWGGVATVQDNAVTVDLPWRDGDGDAGVATLVDSGAEGTATLEGNALTYTPDPGYFGADTLTWYVTDATGAVSNLGTLRVNIHPTPTPGHADMPQFGLNQIQFGLNAAPGDPLSTSTEQYRPETLFAGMEDLGIQTYRQLQKADLVWSSIEPGDGAFADNESLEVLAAGTVEPEVTVFEIQYASPTPPWCTDKSDFQKYMGTDAYRYLDHIIDYYGEYVRYYEVGNEVYHWVSSEPPQSEEAIANMPDCYPVDGYWPMEQGVFLEEAARYIKSGDPDAIITLPAINNNDDLSNDWMRDVIHTASDTEWFDVVAYHSYVAWSKLYTLRPALTQLVNELGIEHKMIKMTEGGSSSDPAKTKKTDYPNSEETQAADIFRMPVIAWGYGDAAFIWHSYIQAPGDDDGGSFSCEILASDGTWRPSAYTVQLMTANLIPFKQVADFSSGGQWRFRVITVDDETRWVVWGDGHYTVPAGITEWTFVLPDPDGEFLWSSTTEGDVLDVIETPILLR